MLFSSQESEKPIFTIFPEIFARKIGNTGISSETTSPGISSKPTETRESRVSRRKPGNLEWADGNPGNLISVSRNSLRSANEADSGGYQLPSYLADQRRVSLGSWDGIHGFHTALQIFFTICSRFFYIYHWTFCWICLRFFSWWKIDLLQ